MLESRTIECPKCKKTSTVKAEKIPTSFTANCSHCGELLLVGGLVKLFHQAINEENPEWPADGAGTGFVEIRPRGAKLCRCDFCTGKKKREDNWCSYCGEVKMEPPKSWENVDCCDDCQKLVDSMCLHSKHGRGNAEDGPDGSDCGCRSTDQQSLCAKAGCGFCQAAQTRALCDFNCSKKAEYDFKTKTGPWANGCEAHWIANRFYQELGTGKGQKL